MNYIGREYNYLALNNISSRLKISCYINNGSRTILLQK